MQEICQRRVQENGENYERWSGAWRSGRIEIL